MKLNVEITSPRAEVLYLAHFRAGERAVTAVMRGAASGLKARWRAQVTGAGLGTRLGNTIRGQAYPQAQDSISAAALVWTKAPKIIAAHEAGPLIVPRHGRWLAIPTEAAGKGRGGKSLSPAEWQQKTGLQLRFVKTGTGNAILVLEDARVSARGLARRKGGRRRRDGILTGATSVVVFVLVRQVKLPKRLDLVREAESVAAAIPGRIAGAWKD